MFFLGELLIFNLLKIISVKRSSTSTESNDSHQTPARGSCSCFVIWLWFQSWCKKCGRSRKTTVVLYVAKLEKHTGRQNCRDLIVRQKKTKQKCLFTWSNWSNFKVTEKQSGCGVTHHITSRCWEAESVAAEQSVHCRGPMRARSLRRHWGPTGWHTFDVF